ncbi:hypothetical protein OG196_14550 [Kitasatospora purpeofusca]|uniref:hypothetical protein n=1 Tax=Kitasatospora purpeofusca TaxID=67352 RepID=UPI002E167E51|nr:hypothetical protein OG196_14550 [Kitasatospora purpeofusca]
MPRALHHFTSYSNWDSIRDSGVLEPRSGQAVSDLDRRPVIWLTDTPNGAAATGIAVERADVRISVHPSQAVHPWQLYREEVPGRATNLDTMGFDADASLVTPLPIPLTAWSSVHRVDTGELLWSGDPTVPLLGPAEGWSLTKQELVDFQDVVTTTIATTASDGALPNPGNWLLWSVVILPKQVGRLLIWAEDPGDESQFRAWMGWRSLRGKAGQLPGLPANWRTP